MKNKIKAIVAITLFVLLSIGVKAQKNVLYGTWSGYSSITYERTFSVINLVRGDNDSNRKGLGMKTLLGVHAGKVWSAYWIREYIQLGVACNFLFGNNRSYFETQLGGGYCWSVSGVREGSRSNDRFLGKANIGYRYEGRWLLFRAGLGFPEILYLSAGYRF